MNIENYFENLEYWKIMFEREDPIPIKDVQAWLYNLTKTVLYLRDVFLADFQPSSESPKSAPTTKGDEKQWELLRICVILLRSISNLNGWR